MGGSVITRLSPAVQAASQRAVPFWRRQVKRQSCCCGGEQCPAPRSWVFHQEWHHPVNNVLDIVSSRRMPD